jgi:hypothetical protein
MSGHSRLSSVAAHTEYVLRRVATSVPIATLIRFKSNGPERFARGSESVPIGRGSGSVATLRLRVGRDLT